LAMMDPNENQTVLVSDEHPETIGGTSDAATRILDRYVDDQIAVQQLGQLSLFWRRFRRHKIALVGAFVMLFVIVFAILGPYITPEQPTQFNFNCGYRPCPPAWNFLYLFGADVQGHSVMMQVLLGAGPSLEVGFVSAGLTTIIGILVGSIAGYFGGFTDALFMRITDVFLALPFLPMLIVSEKFFAQIGIFFICIIFAIL